MSKNFVSLLSGHASY